VTVVPLWDGETLDPSGPLLNRFGGNPVQGKRSTVHHTTELTRSGRGALRISTGGPIPPGGFDFVATALTGFGPTAEYVDTRDVSRFESLSFWVLNDTGSPLTLVVEIKDYRDSNDHRARRRVPLTSARRWVEVALPLSLGEAWEVIGSPDLGRARLFALVLEADRGARIDGSLYVDDMVLVEAGGPIDSHTADLETLAEIVARRQFEGLWGARDRRTGLTPSISSFADVCATNVLAGLIFLLPEAVERGWLSPTESHLYVRQVVGTLEGLMDRAVHLPPRYVDRVTLEPTLLREESSVDAAMLFLALYRYRSRPEALPTSARIDRLLDRFDFAAFATPAGWALAYDYESGALTAGTYDGYSGEPWLISLAAHLGRVHRVDVEALYHSAVLRVRDHLVDPEGSHLVHSSMDFRAPFLQWLFPLFVDVGARGVDTFPVPELAANPLDNAILYQLEANARAAALGRAELLQPDAGDDGSGADYRQFSFYEDFGRPELFMPWSVAFALLADADAGGLALRRHLESGLHGPLGLTDGVRWPTGDPQPALVTARHDLWNVALSTIALVAFLGPRAEGLAALPQVRDALDRVFLSPCAGDPHTLCLAGERFLVTARWAVGGGAQYAADAMPLTSDTGWFWFFRPSNVELIVKVLDGCTVNGRFWVFAAGLTNVEVELQVEDLEAAGEVRRYVNVAGTPFAPVLDTGAFATCGL